MSSRYEGPVDLYRRQDRHAAGAWLGIQPWIHRAGNVYLKRRYSAFRAPKVDERFDEIESFGDIGAYIDQPVKTRRATCGT